SSNGPTQIPRILLTGVEPVTSAIRVTAAESTLSTVGSTTQVTATCLFPEAGQPAGVEEDCTAPEVGTTYGSSNPAVCTVDATASVTAVGSGTCIVTAANEGVVGSTRITVELAGNH